MNYTDMIEPLSKKEDVLLKISSFKPEIIINDNDLLEIKIINNYGEELLIDIKNEFSLFFGDWHSHYFAYTQEYNCFIDDLLGILENRKYTICAYKKDKWCGSMLLEGEVIDYDSIVDDLGEGKTIKCSFWDKSKNYIINL